MIEMKSLSPVQQKFILHWGEMGTRWGINRTVAQIHAVLFISPDPLTAEEITETLGMSPNTLRTHMQNVLTKLGVHSKLDAIVAAIRHGKVNTVNVSAGDEGTHDLAPASGGGEESS